MLAICFDYVRAMLGHAHLLPSRDRAALNRAGHPGTLTDRIDPLNEITGRLHPSAFLVPLVRDDALIGTRGPEIDQTTQAAHSKHGARRLVLFKAGDVAGNRLRSDATLRGLLENARTISKPVENYGMFRSSLLHACFTIGLSRADPMMGTSFLKGGGNCEDP